MHSFQVDKNNDTNQTQSDQKKVQLSYKLLNKICRDFNIIIEKNKNKKTHQKDIFADDSLFPPSMKRTLKSIVSFIQNSYPPPNDEGIAEELNGTLIYLKKNIDIFIKKGNLLTQKNVSNITKISFMLSNKSYAEAPFRTEDYTKILYTWPAAQKQRKKLPEKKKEELARLDQKKLVKLERDFLNAIDHELYLPTKKLISIYEIPTLTLFGKTPEDDTQLLTSQEEPTLDIPSLQITI
jgi:hypothetical protein